MHTFKRPMWTDGLNDLPDYIDPFQSTHGCFDTDGGDGPGGGDKNDVASQVDTFSQFNGATPENAPNGFDPNRGADTPGLAPNDAFFSGTDVGRSGLTPETATPEQRRAAATQMDTAKNPGFFGAISRFVSNMATRPTLSATDQYGRVRANREFDPLALAGTAASAAGFLVGGAPIALAKTAIGVAKDARDTGTVSPLNLALNASGVVAPSSAFSQIGTVYNTIQGVGDGIETVGNLFDIDTPDLAFDLDDYFGTKVATNVPLAAPGVAPTGNTALALNEAFGGGGLTTPTTPTPPTGAGLSLAESKAGAAAGIQTANATAPGIGQQVSNEIQSSRGRGRPDTYGVETGTAAFQVAAAADDDISRGFGQTTARFGSFRDSNYNF